MFVVVQVSVYPTTSLQAVVPSALGEFCGLARLIRQAPLQRPVNLGAVVVVAITGFSHHIVILGLYLLVFAIRVKYVKIKLFFGWLPAGYWDLRSLNLIR